MEKVNCGSLIHFDLHLFVLFPQKRSCFRLINIYASSSSNIGLSGGQIVACSVKVITTPPSPLGVGGTMGFISICGRCGLCARWPCALLRNVGENDVERREMTLRTRCRVHAPAAHHQHLFTESWHGTGRVTLKRAMTDSCWGKAASERTPVMNGGIVVLCAERLVEAVRALTGVSSRALQCLVFLCKVLPGGGPAVCLLDIFMCRSTVTPQFDRMLVHAQLWPCLELFCLREDGPLPAHSDFVLGLWSYRFQVTQASTVPLQFFFLSFVDTYYSNATSAAPIFWGQLHRENSAIFKSLLPLFDLY